MEDFIEIIFYVVILVLSGIGSLVKNKKKNQAQRPQPLTESHDTSNEQPAVYNENDEENELIRMLREASEAAAAQQREQELFEEQQQAQLKEEQRQKELAEKARQAEILRTKREAERAKTQTKTPKIESESNTANDSPIIDLDFSNVDDVRKAFIASEIFNKKYC
jgi:cell division protein FtsN